MSKEKKNTTVDTPEYEKKVKKSYAIRTVIGTIIGGIIGALMVLGTHFFKEPVAEFAKMVMNQFPHFQIYVCPVIMLIVVIVCTLTNKNLLKKAKEQIASWDGEDEKHIDTADEFLSKGLRTISTEVILINIIFAVTTYCLFKNLDSLADSITLLIGTAIFFAGLMIPVSQQNKMVKLSKEYSPEKQGSIYDKNFSDVWYDSCDEAERQLIHEAAFHSYQTMSKILSAVLAVTTILGMFVPIGILCSVIVGSFLFLQNYTYQKECQKLEHKNKEL